MNIQKEIGMRLKALRDERGLRQKDLADRLGVTPAAYGKFEAGDRGLNSEYCIALADYYGISCDYILRGINSDQIDICSKTCLTSDTVDALSNRFNQDYTAIYEAFTDDLLKIFDENDETVIDAYFDKRSTTEKVNRHAALKKRDHAMNILLQDDMFWEEFYHAIIPIKRGLIDLDLIPVPEMNVNDPSYEEAQYNYQDRVTNATMTLNAGRYAASQAFAHYLERLENDESFRKSYDD